MAAERAQPGIRSEPPHLAPPCSPRHLSERWRRQRWPYRRASRGLFGHTSPSAATSRDLIPAAPGPNRRPGRHRRSRYGAGSRVRLRACCQGASGMLSCRHPSRADLRGPAACLAAAQFHPPARRPGPRLPRTPGAPCLVIPDRVQDCVPSFGIGRASRTGSPKGMPVSRRRSLRARSGACGTVRRPRRMPVPERAQEGEQLRCR